MSRNALVWFRNDLRIADNPALCKAFEQGGHVVAVYIHESGHNLRERGGASRWWLHRSLQFLAADLAEIGVRLHVESGKADDVLRRLVAEHQITAVYWNRRYGPAERELDGAIKEGLSRDGIDVASLPGSLLVEPWEIATGQGKPYAVYTPFWNSLRNRDIGLPLQRPRHGGSVSAPSTVDGDYREPQWGRKLGRHWSTGEKAARDKLADFLDGELHDYAGGRDFPARDVTSRLSPHLAFGEISPRQIWQACQHLVAREHRLGEVVGKFLSELGWREFNYHQLYHRPDISREPMQQKYASLAWRQDKAGLERWQQGQTGIPIVDAGMRELWETGYMHNRVRMLTASLLTKNLLVDWRHGEQWFWDTLLDADPADNPGNWQWVAGSGLDASPYFRIFNPVTQGERFDGEGDYVRRWVPEVAALPDKFLHAPSEAPKDVLDDAGIVLDETYPRAIVDLKATRQRALDAMTSR